MTVVMPDLSRAGLAEALRQAVKRADAARAAYDAQMAAPHCDPERNKALSREIVRADAMMGSLGRQVLSLIMGDCKYEPKVTVHPTGS
jgi:hypothetical protein